MPIVPGLLVVLAVLLAPKRADQLSLPLQGDVLEAFGANAQCAHFNPGGCFLHKHTSEGGTVYCHQGDGLQTQCNFDDRFLRDCPLFIEGNFSVVEPAKEGPHGLLCSPRFMYTGSEHRPACGSSCCSVSLAGRFHQLNNHHHRWEYQPQANGSTGCRFHKYAWRDALECLAGARVVIAGDSIMRQLFNRAVTMFRGQEDVVDFNAHAHSRYRVCDAGDKLTFSSFLPKRWVVPLDEIQKTFGPPANPGFLSYCKTKPAEMNYLWAPRFMDLTPALQTFHGAFGNEGPLAYIVFGGFWEDQPTVADDYLLTLDLIRSTANALIVVGVPRVRLYGPPNRNAQIRNEVMRKWASSRSPEAGGNVFYLDFNAMAEAPDAPPGLASSNWHFQCFLDPNHNQEARRELGNLKAAWHWPGLPGHIYPSVWTDSEGTCDDEINRNIWQMLFNILCNKRPKH